MKFLNVSVLRIVLTGIVLGGFLAGCSCKTDDKSAEPITVVEEANTQSHDAGAGSALAEGSLVGSSSVDGSSVDGSSVDNTLIVTNAHMFELAPGQMHGAIYLVLNNNGEASRQLVDVATSVAGTAMVHRTFYEDGMMRMRHVHHLSVGPKQTLVFEPNGYHIMLMDMEGVPKAGGRFVMDLAFDKGQSIAVEVEVKSQH